MVQNKLHYAHMDIQQQRIYGRVDASQPFMGLKSFSGDFPVLKDISIAKNYLNDGELEILNNIVSGYFNFAKIQAMCYNPMYMADSTGFFAYQLLVRVKNNKNFVSSIMKGGFPK